jgi:hypothetical protein
MFVFVFQTCFYLREQLLMQKIIFSEGCLHLIPSPSPYEKIKIMGAKIAVAVTKKDKEK